MPQDKAPSLAGRTVIALLLMVGFYVLAIAVCALLGFFLYVGISGGYFNLYLTLFALFAIGVILWSILPRWDRFVPPGPLLTEDSHPRLFAVLKSISEATGQSMPVEVYLLPEANAFVAQRGGILGLGSRRVMGIGLPLLKMLTVSELKAVLVHEFGHFYGGDTRLGPLIYRTRGMVIRTVSSLNWDSIFTYVVRLPFYGYAKLYLRITQGVSRAQELSADRLAARIAGSRQMIQALRAVHGAGLAWNVYWRDEFVPALVQGFAPPLAEGFGQFLKAAPVVRQMSDLVEKESRESQTNAYDSHPSLKDRIAALESVNVGPGHTDDSSAISLIESLGNLEMEILDPLAKKNHLPELKAISWDSLPSLMYLPNFQKLVMEQRQFLVGITPESLPDLAGNPEKALVRLADVQNLTAEQLNNLMLRVVGSALTLALMKNGWRISTSPGEPLYVVKDGQKIAGFEVLTNLRSHLISGEEWVNNCHKLGIYGVDLAATAQ